jgi:hypothetical protein
MRRLLIPALLTLLSVGAWAAENSAISDFKTAMQGQDATAKKTAVKALANPSAGSDADVLPLLVQALSDRQVSDQALEALRARTGLQPPTNKRLGGPGYPGYPKDDSSGSWSAWLDERKKAKEQEELLKALKDKETGDKGKGKDGKAPGDAPITDDPSGVAKPAPTVVDTDLGTLDRVILKTGGALLCYVLNKRLDADGNLISVRIAHPDGGGEEVLQAEFISRIEEDVK